ncbi:MAG: ABC transporter permease [Bacteroidota bacterium]|jgi:putative ABC transport system permease protein|nr:FtsX-like permease family protein [Ignavibacteria bacterium]MCU7498975.1 FtsX-like permease family protein [Ignavibacteria bacterium]MCU7512450.1 FtsX-like permease family protein [Ignavibacteria bacterium]MCU7518579.1 FtsX-like permease family protein [Ignavibacteria bacterium]MCU7524263.1 FtsX-like permease family protein [Ignavibacteria bacterium]
MKIKEVFLVAFNALKVNKLRSFLTILGIVVGIFSIISISTVIAMLQNSIEEGTSMLGQNTFQIQKFPAMQEGGPGSRDKFRNRKDLTLEEYYRLKDLLTIAEYVGAEQWNFGKIVKYESIETNPNVQISGITPEAQPNNKWVVEDGRAINNSDVEHYSRVCVVGKDVAKKIFTSVDPIGQYIRVDGKKLQVIGVYESQGEMFGQSRDNFVVMPITAYQSFYGKTNNSINITVMSRGKDTYDQTIESAVGYMRTIRKVGAGEENDFEIFSNETVMQTINGIKQGAEIGAMVIAAIALLAAGVGIMNIMLVSVTERTREIGVRKAIGAQKKNILIQFLFEAVVLSVSGGIIGILFGVGIGNLAGLLLKATPTFPIMSVLTGVIVCLAIGITFGTYPAYKAANLDPIEALRYE